MSAFASSVIGTLYIIAHAKLFLLLRRYKTNDREKIAARKGNISIWSIKDMTNITMRESEYYNIVPVQE